MSEGERRLAAIMYTDMVGYTALGQRNETLSLALVEEQRKLIRPILARHNGREIKTMGDAFLVEFPNALDAVRCAYDIQRATREFNISLLLDKRIHLRVGLHLGDVVESQGDISGDAVNVASRIEPLAEDGGVCVTRPVYDSMHNKLDVPFASMGMKSLKNVTEPMEVFKMKMPWEQTITAEAVAYPANRIAILPFVSMSTSPDDAFFADGMTEEVISTVSGISGLEVISRTSVMGYKGTAKKVKEIGKELEVGSVLEGSFRKAGSRIRVTTQLIDVARDKHLWAQSYDRSLDDIFEVQSDVAKQVAEVLKVRILTPEMQRIEKKPTESVEAHTLYLKGIHYLPSDRAIEYFKLAFEQDPSFALAYAKTAECYVLLADETMPSRDAVPKAKEYVAQALSLDDRLAEAHCVQAMIANQYDWDWAEAEKSFRKALALNPSLAEAHTWFSFFLAMMGRFKEAVFEADRACELDPMSSFTFQLSGYICLIAGEYGKARALEERSRELAPGNAYAHINLALISATEGKFEEALKEADEALKLSEALKLDEALKHTSLRSFQAQVCAMAGLKEKAGEIVDGLLSNKYAGSPSLSQIGRVYYLLGEKDKGWELMRKAYEARDTSLAMLNTSPFTKAAREDPRFVELLGKMKLT